MLGVYDLITLDEKYVFEDDFETGDFSWWFSQNDCAVQSGVKLHGGFSAATTNTGVANLDTPHGLNLSTSYVRFYYRFTSLPGTGVIFCQVEDATTPGNWIYSLGLDTDGTLFLLDNGFGSLGSLAGTLLPNTTYCVELKTVIAGGGGGSVELRIDGIIAGTFTGLTNNALGNVDHVGFGDNTGGPVPNTICYFDDVAISGITYPGRIDPFSDGFETNSFLYWPNGGGSQSIVSSPVNNGGFSALIPSQTGFGYKETTDIWDTQFTFYSRVYIYISGTPSNEAFFHNHNITLGANITELHLDTSRKIVAWNVSGGLPANILGTGSAVIPINKWTCVELKTVVGGGNGSVTVRVNGIVDATYTGLNNVVPGLAAGGGINCIGLSNISMIAGSYNSAATGIDINFDDVAARTDDWPGLIFNSGWLRPVEYDNVPKRRPVRDNIPSAATLRSLTVQTTPGPIRPTPDGQNPVFSKKILTGPPPVMTQPVGAAAQTPTREFLVREDNPIYGRKRWQHDGPSRFRETQPPPRGWNPVPDQVPRKPLYREQPPALALTPDTLPPRVAGMAWFQRWSADIVTRPTFSQPPTNPAFVPSAVPIAGMSFVERWSIDPVRKPVFSDPPALTLTPDTLPPKIAGMAWFAPPDYLRKAIDRYHGPAAWAPQVVAPPPGGAPPQGWFVPPQELRRVGRVRDDAAGFVPEPGDQPQGWYVLPQEFVARVNKMRGEPGAMVFPIAVPIFGFAAAPDELPRRLRQTAGIPAGAPLVIAPIPTGWQRVDQAFRLRAEVRVEIPRWTPRTFQPPVGISGMAWFTPPDPLSTPRPKPLAKQHGPEGWDPQFVLSVPPSPTDPLRIVYALEEIRIVYALLENRTVVAEVEDRIVFADDEDRTVD